MLLMSNVSSFVSLLCVSEALTSSKQICQGHYFQYFQELMLYNSTAPCFMEPDDVLQLWYWALVSVLIGPKILQHYSVLIFPTFPWCFSDTTNLHPKQLLLQARHMIWIICFRWEGWPWSLLVEESPLYRFYSNELWMLLYSCTHFKGP